MGMMGIITIVDGVGVMVLWDKETKDITILLKI